MYHFGSTSSSFCLAYKMSFRLHVVESNPEETELEIRNSQNEDTNTVIHRVQIKPLNKSHSLFHCAACDVFLLFGPSTRLMSFGWKKSVLWVTVTVTVFCTCLPSTTLMRPFMSLTISWLLGVQYGKRRIKSLMPCYKMTLTHGG